ncbi:MAG TPA: hypothetical protein VLN59_01265, partial [Burkholderiales bacterium]|nr:hypothetical protein [Burkholderiales bacterium]
MSAIITNPSRTRIPQQYVMHSSWIYELSLTDEVIAMCGYPAIRFVRAGGPAQPASPRAGFADAAIVGAAQNATRPDKSKPTQPRTWAS